MFIKITSVNTMPSNKRMQSDKMDDSHLRVAFYWVAWATANDHYGRFPKREKLQTVSFYRDRSVVMCIGYKTYTTTWKQGYSTTYIPLYLLIFSKRKLSSLIKKIILIN